MSFLFWGALNKWPHIYLLCGLYHLLISYVSYFFIIICCNLTNILRWKLVLRNKKKLTGLVSGLKYKLYILHEYVIYINTSNNIKCI